MSPERWAIKQAYHAAYRKAHPEKWKQAKLKDGKTKGANYAAASRLRKAEAAATRPCPELCEACGRPPFKRGIPKPRLDWDHDHVTGKFRGWLCGHCNKALGLVQDSSSRLESLIQYLHRNT